MAEAANQKLQAALAEEQWGDVARILDTVELESGDPDVLTREWPLALHLLGHIYNHNLEDARFLWKRAPEAAKSGNPELDAVWRLLQYLWNQRYSGVWEALQGYQWSAQVRPLVDALVVRTRERTSELLARAYSVLPLAKAASLLGSSEADTLALAQAAGWEYDASSSMLAPREAAGVGAEPDSSAALQQLSNYMLHLEA